MPAISACPKCHEAVSIPAGVALNELVHCPFCLEEFLLGEVVSPNIVASALEPSTTSLDEYAGFSMSMRADCVSDMSAGGDVPAGFVAESISTPPAEEAIITVELEQPVVFCQDASELVVEEFLPIDLTSADAHQSLADNQTDSEMEFAEEGDCLLIEEPASFSVALESETAERIMPKDSVAPQDVFPEDAEELAEVEDVAEILVAEEDSDSDLVDEEEDLLESEYAEEEMSDEEQFSIEEFCIPVERLFDEAQAASGVDMSSTKGDFFLFSLPVIEEEATDKSEEVEQPLDDLFMMSPEPRAAEGPAALVAEEAYGEEPLYAEGLEESELDEAAEVTALDVDEEPIAELPEAAQEASEPLVEEPLAPPKKSSRSRRGRAPALAQILANLT